MKRVLGFTYGIICYAVFLFVFLRAVWFVWTMDGLEPKAPLTSALLIRGSSAAA